ncbi:DUF3954 domain-containing protein [Bacillus mesophilum]|uniref:DUF3954 domain-containing protein n=1 Tax=Bacillus mesophilum TaxID=1071718 RepID=A0A7V7UWL2_9BACI|nr:DUF3954 domain-containing protein [Bacillus mesophilum]KAB2334285.1 DUF3954 domain-containing protein [Bacillus mesophilum]
MNNKKLVLPKKETIDLTENATYVVSDGKLEKLPMPRTGYGEHVVEWLGGHMHKSVNTEVKKAVRNE